MKEVVHMDSLFFYGSFFLLKLYSEIAYETINNQRTMKLHLLAVASVFIAFASIGQTVHQDYLDGAIWFKLKNDLNQCQTVNIQTGEVSHRQIDLKKLDFYSDLERFGIKNLKETFPNVKDEKLTNVFRFEFQDISAVDEIIRLLESSKAIVYAERIPYIQKTLTPNDPNYNSSTQWGLFQMNAALAWDISTGSNNVKVAIVDDAVETTHSDLSGVIWTNPNEVPNNGIDDDNNGYIDDVNGFDVANSDNNPDPDNPISSYDHGTHVAGIAGAETNNNNGVASIGHNITLIPVKSTNSATAVTHGYEGIIYAVAAGADVINMSWGGSGSSTTAQNIISYASGEGIVLIAAAGNDNVSSIFYPAGYSEVIAVASTTFGDSKSSFSNYGSWIDISAPGSAIYSTIPGNSYGTKQGTSMASPQVAGLVGLMLSLNPSLTPADIESCILSTADNIDTQNPSYVGELGAGRINAQAAMNCILATLNWAPEANFQGDVLNILEGQNVNFTDLSIYNPTSWSWTFNGGTPATFNGQNPPAITYNTAGTYEVSLTATNANGADTETKSAYITVNALTGCDTISNTEETDGITIVSWSGGNGYLSGHNGFSISRFAEEYSAFGPTNIMGADLYFAEANVGNANSDVTVMVWEDNAGEPGTVVYQEDIPITVIENNVTSAGAGSFFITQVNFDTPVSVGTGTFYVGYSIENAAAAGDTVACGNVNVTTDGARPNKLFAFFGPGSSLGYSGWEEFPTFSSGSQFVSHIYPRITQTPPTAVITANPNTVCEGEFIDFDASSSPNIANWEWAINGTSTPSPTAIDPSVNMGASGTHTAYLLVENSCGFFHIDSLDVTVNPSPNVAVTGTADTICPGGTIAFSASGASSYTWSPAGSLSCSNCANPTATPATNTTYTVTGTTGSCSSETYYAVVVKDAAPVAEFLMSSDTICVGDVLELNGGLSDGASVFDWDFPNGSPATGVGSISSTSYSATGTYTITLDVDNGCGATDNTIQDVVVLPAGECSAGLSLDSAEELVLFYAPKDENVIVKSADAGLAYVISSAGQKMTTTKNLEGGDAIINVSHLSKGMYFVVIEGHIKTITHKFVR
jgi:PKD repeat protein